MEKVERAMGIEPKRDPYSYTLAQVGVKLRSAAELSVNSSQTVPKHWRSRCIIGLARFSHAWF
jgi:hypothetical protein